MPISTTSKNAMLDAEFVTGDLLCLHTADPGTTVGASEVSGGGYARQALAYDTAASGQKLLNGTEAFSIPASTTVTHYSIINAAANRVKASGPLSASEAFTGAGTYTCTEITLS